jgi:site-specific recombinase XerD
MDQLFSNRLGLHQFAHLRAVTHGMPIQDAAKQFLGITHGAQAGQAHRAVLAKIQAIARRCGDPRWRLLGLPLLVQTLGPDGPPNLDAWAAQQGLQEWSQAEQLALYQEHFAPDSQTQRKQVRRERLITKRLHLLRDLQMTQLEPVQAHERIDIWFSNSIAQSCLQLGMLTLADLSTRIGRGGRWWCGLPGVGKIKAQRLADYLDGLIGHSTAPLLVFEPAQLQTAQSAALVPAGANRAPRLSQAIDADSDPQAVQCWIAARAGSAATARCYAREMERFLLWASLERTRSLSQLTAQDCRAYMDFIAEVPSRWISRRKASRAAPGWAPFKGGLSLASQRQAITTLHSAFDWLVKAGYLLHNPWHLVNRKLGDDPLHAGSDPSSRALSPALWSVLKDQNHAETQSDNKLALASAQRMQWLLVFMEATGLRAAELLRSTRGDLTHEAEGWSLRVHGKGRRNRIIPVPSTAMLATQTYFAARGLALEAAPLETPLMSSLTAPHTALSYEALHQSIKSVLRRAKKGLEPQQARTLERASMHWLRHTHATRAAERGVPPDVLQENLGQSDPRTTANYYRAQIQRRRAALEAAFGVVE